jgi:hypothetical protein
MLAFVFLLAAPSWAGVGPASLPGIGTFSYNGPALNAATAHLVVADGRRATLRESFPEPDTRIRPAAVQF